MAYMKAVMPFFVGPFVWGQRDCCLSASDAFLSLHGVDPMRDLRGQYSDRAGAAHMVRASGGFAALCRDQAARAGLIAGRGDAGEIGLISVPGAGRALGICTAPGFWMVKTAAGAVTVPDVQESWSCPQQ